MSSDIDNPELAVTFDVHTCAFHGDVSCLDGCREESQQGRCRKDTFRHRARILLEASKNNSEIDTTRAQSARLRQDLDTAREI